MKKRITKFGSLQPLLIRDGKVITELATFTSNGRPHKHDKSEICYVISGKGIIQYDYHDHLEHKFKVEPGSVVVIPPNTDHWMEVAKGESMEILLVYSDNVKAKDIG